MARLVEKDDEIIIESDNLPEKTDSLEHQAANEWFDTSTEQDVQMGVYQDIPGQRGLSFMFNFFPSDYTKETLQQFLKAKYGGGNYRVQARSGGKLRINMPISITDEPKQEYNNNELSDLKGIIKDMQSTDNNQMMTLMMTMQENAATRQAEMMQASQNQMMQFMTLIVSNKNDQPAHDPLAMLAAAKDLLGNGNNDNPMEYMFKGIELAKELAPENSDKESNTNDLLLGLAKAFGAPLANMAANQHKLSVATQAKALENQRIPVKQDTTVDTIAELKSNITKVLDLAEKEIDTDLSLDLIYSFISESQALEIERFLKDENWFVLFCQLDERAASYEKWLVDLRVAYLSDIEPDPTIEGEEGLTGDIESVNNADGELLLSKDTSESRDSKEVTNIEPESTTD